MISFNEILSEVPFNRESFVEERNGVILRIAPSFTDNFLGATAFQMPEGCKICKCVVAYSTSNQTITISFAKDISNIDMVEFLRYVLLWSKNFTQVFPGEDIQYDGSSNKVTIFLSKKFVTMTKEFLYLLTDFWNYAVIWYENSNLYK